MKPLRIFLLSLALVVCVSSFAFAQKAGVIGTVHDISGAGCTGCHGPHNGSVATGGTDQNTGKILLWDRAFTTETFGVYDSPNLLSTPLEVGTTTPLATDARLYSFLCMSCHDGVTSATLIAATDAAAVGNVTNSAGLTNDHPVNMDYDTSILTTTAGYAAVAAVETAGLKFFGTGNTVQCASCHEPHNNTNIPFLRKSNTASALCLTCHL